MTSIRRVLAWAVVGLSVVGVAPSNAEEAADEVGAILSRHVGVYTTPPNTVGELDPSIKAYRIPDGPLMGNGDLAVAVGGTDRAQTFYLSKSDLSHSMRGLGGLTYTFEATPADPGAYRQEQDLYRSEVRSILPFEKATVRMRSFTADAGNVLVTELWTEGSSPDRGHAEDLVAHQRIDHAGFYRGRDHRVHPRDQHHDGDDAPAVPFRGGDGVPRAGGEARLPDGSEEFLHRRLHPRPGGQGPGRHRGGRWVSGDRPYLPGKSPG